MQAQELVKACRPKEALGALEQQIRKAPADAKLRMFLFQLCAVLGDWERAMNQLNVATEMDPQYLLDAHLYRGALQAEVFRAGVFAGTHAPLIFGEPAGWVGHMVQANDLQAKGQHAAAVAMRTQALDVAPVVSGSIDGKPFAWLMDADARLGPMFEAVINGKYYWVPMMQVASIKIDPPAELRDVVWSMVHFQWINGGEVAGLMPTRYPGSETSDSRHMMSRQTDWTELTPDLQRGLGQRLFATDEGDVAQMEMKQIKFDVTVTPPPPTGDANG